MRNKTVELTDVQYAHVVSVAARLTPDTVATLTYGKREDADYNGSITGTVVSVKVCADTTASALIDSDRGPRTISLHLVREVI